MEAPSGVEMSKDDNSASVGASMTRIIDASSGSHHVIL